MRPIGAKQPPLFRCRFRGDSSCFTLLSMLFLQLEIYPNDDMPTNMSRPGVASTLLAFAIVAVVVVSAVALMAVQTGLGTTTPSNHPTSTSTTATGSQSSTPPSGENLSVISIQGLELMVSTNATEIPVGKSVEVSLSEFNTLSAPNNVSASHDWPTQVALGACENIYVQPFGIAVYAGHVDGENLSQGKRVNIFPPTACPQYVRLVTGYEFQPRSDLAVVLPGYGANPSPLAGSVNIEMSYSPQGQPILPGSYTIVAADEWGALAFVYFTVH